MRKRYIALPGIGLMVVLLSCELALSPTPTRGPDVEATYEAIHRARVESQEAAADARAEEALEDLHRSFASEEATRQAREREEYWMNSAAILHQVVSTLEMHHDLMDDAANNPSLLTDPEWRHDVANIVMLMRGHTRDLRELDPPEHCTECQEVQRHALETMEQFEKYADALAGMLTAIDENNEEVAKREAEKAHKAWQAM